MWLVNGLLIVAPFGVEVLDFYIVFGETRFLNPRDKFFSQPCVSTRILYADDPIPKDGDL